MLGFSDTFVWMAGFALASALVNTLGIWTIFKYRGWAERAKVYFICFAAGVLLSVPLTLALPEAIEKNSYAGFVALAGFLFMLVSNRVIGHYTKQKSLAFGITAAEGIGLHSFIDGIIFSVTFRSSILIGALAGTGMVVHEFAEGIITYLVLTAGGVKGRTALLYAFFIAALTTPVGAFIAYPIVNRLGELELSLLLGFAAGVLLYVSAAHLLPEAREEDREHSYLAFLAGVAVALFITLTQLA
ncbi:MAG: ZIP family metal transporter [Anaerolineales bacterium]